MIRFSFFIIITFFLLLSFLFTDFFSSLKSYISLLLGMIIFFMAMTVNVNHLQDVLKKPQLILITVVLQYSIMPTLAYLIAKTFNLSSEITLGFIILGSCPGGTASNVITYLCKGNVPLSLICTLISTILSVVFTPYLIVFFTDQTINIDVNSLIYSTSKIILIPMILGFLVRMFLYDFFQKIKPSLPIISEITIALVIAIIFAVNSDSLETLNIKIFLSVVLHNVGGLLIGYHIARFLNLPHTSIKTISIEVGMQNSGLAMALAVVHFTKIVALPAAIFSLWHNISASVLVYLSKKK